MRVDWALAVLVGAVALAVRWSQAAAAPIVDEPGHYLAARELWRLEWHALDMDGEPLPSVRWLFWQRPAFSLLYFPAASLSFEAYRVMQAFVSSAIAVLALLLLRRMDVQRWIALGVGAVIALHPQFVVWGGYVLPDAMLVVLTLLALHAAHAGRPGAMALFLLMAAWTKETGIVTACAILLLAWLREADGSRPPSWPLGLGRFGSAAAAVVAMAFAPLVYSLSLPLARFPGWLSGGSLARVPEHILVLIWIAPLVAAALWLRESRRFAVVAWAWIAFFLAYRVLLGKFVNDHYMPMPGTMTMLAAGLGLSALARRAHAAGNAARPWVVRGVAVLLLAAFAVQIAVPGTSPLNKAVASPLSQEGQWNLREAKEWRGAHADDLEALLARVPASEQEVIAVDVHWSFAMYQVPNRFPTTYIESGFISLLFDTDPHRLVNRIENSSALLLIGGDSPNNLQTLLRETYAPCRIDQQGAFDLIRGADCRGQAERTGYFEKAERARH